MDEESKEVSGDLVTLSEKVELDLQKDDLTELMAVQREELTNDDLMELEAQRKGEERQEKEVTEEPKRFMTQEMSRRLSLFEEALFVLRHSTQTERYTTVTAVVQNVIQCYHVICDEKKRTTTQASLESFFGRIDRIGSSKEPEPVPLLLSMSEIAACPPSPFADSPAALSPTSSPYYSPVTLLADALDASPCMSAVCTVLCTCQAAVL